MKNWGLPLPSDALVLPVGFKPSAARAALAAKMDSWMAQWEAGAQAILYMADVARCPAIFLDELGWLLQAGIMAGDSDQGKRIKIATAAQAHQTHGTWLYDVEPKIFAVTGIVPGLFGSLYLDWWVRSGGGFYPSSSYWAIRGGNGDANLTGMIRAGSGDDGIIGTVVYVDLVSSTLTAEQIAAVVASITGSVSCYFRVILGYVVSGVFTPYAGGRIN